MPQHAISTSEASERLQVSTRTMRRYLAEGIEGAVKDPDSGTWEIPMVWVEARLAEAAAGDSLIVEPNNSNGGAIDLRDPDVAAGLADFLDQFSSTTNRMVEAEVRAGVAETARDQMADQLNRASMQIEEERAFRHKLEVDMSETTKALALAEQQAKTVTERLNEQTTKRDQLEEQVASQADQNQELLLKTARLEGLLGPIGRRRLRRLEG